MVPYYTVMDQRLGRSRTLQTCYYRKYTWLKGRPDPSHCTVQINIEKADLTLNDSEMEFLDQLKND